MWNSSPIQFGAVAPITGDARMMRDQAEISQLRKQYFEQARNASRYKNYLTYVSVGAVGIIGLLLYKGR